MASVLNNAQLNKWAGAYPLNHVVAYDATDANTLLIGFYTTNTAAYTPTCTYNGDTATLISSHNVAGDHGTLWIWQLVGPDAGTHDIIINSPTNYGPLGGSFAVGVEHPVGMAVLIGDYDITGGSGPLSLTLSAVGDDSITVGWGAGVYATSITVGGTPTPTTLVTLTDAQVPMHLATQTGFGISDSVVFTTNPGVTNYNFAMSIELLGAPMPQDIIAPVLSMTFSTTAGAIVGPQVINAPVLSMAFDTTAASLQIGQFPMTLAPGSSITIHLTATPSAPGVRTAQINIVSNAPTSIDHVLLSVTGGGVPGTMSRLHTLGNQIVDDANEPVRLRSVNWFGAEGTNNTPHGTWVRRYTGILDQIKAMGFNCIRMPFHGGWSNTALAVSGANYDSTQNPEFVGKTAYEIMDLILDYCEDIGLYVVLDHHRRVAGAGADGSPVGSGYTEANWINTWSVMANRYKDHMAVVGADLHNEPHDLEWNDWVVYAQNCGNAIHAIAPEWNIFVEGVGEYLTESYWWGGQLKGVADTPVVLTVPNKLIYSPHEYGISVAPQPWLKSDSNSGVVDYPHNLYAIMHEFWGFIFYDLNMPVWVGEFGGKFGVNGSGGADGTPTNATYELQWVDAVGKFCNGDADGDGISDLGAGDLGISYAYWSYNPNSGDTGGLVQDDWVTEQGVKLTAINQMLTE